MIGSALGSGFGCTTGLGLTSTLGLMAAADPVPGFTAVGLGVAFALGSTFGSTLGLGAITTLGLGTATIFAAGAGVVTTLGFGLGVGATTALGLDTVLTWATPPFGLALRLALGVGAGLLRSCGLPPPLDFLALSLIALLPPLGVPQVKPMLLPLENASPLGAISLCYLDALIHGY